MLGRNALLLLWLVAACDRESQGAGPANSTATAAPPAAASEKARPPAAPTAQGRPEIGRCHMGDCSWSVILAREPVRRSASGQLVKLTLRGGTSHHEDEDYPSDSRGVRIEWNSEPHEVFIFCSRVLPTVILAVDGGYQADVLDFVSGPPPALESSANLYARVCHDGADWSGSNYARRFGYQVPSDEFEVELQRPEDIFLFAD